MLTALIHIMQQKKIKIKIQQQQRIRQMRELIGIELENKVAGKRTKAEKLTD